MKKLYLIFILFAGIANAQQIGDPDFNPPIFNPAYQSEIGSNIYIDEAHNNFHTIDGRYINYLLIFWQEMDTMSDH